MAKKIRLLRDDVCLQRKCLFHVYTFYFILINSIYFYLF